METLKFIQNDISLSTIDLIPEYFRYELIKSTDLLVLEAQMRESILEILIIIVIPIIILFVVLALIVGMPLKQIDRYINRLRTNPEVNNDNYYRGFFQVSELNLVYDSLIKYHTELIQKEEHMSLTLNSIGDAVITTDSKNMIVRMNPVAEQLTGWDFKDAAGKPVNQIFNILNASSREKIDTIFDSVLDAGEIVHLSKDTVLVSKSKAEYHISDSAAPIRDSAGNILGMVLVFNDITERKLKDEQLQQSQKMDALGKLTGGIAHDFNNLLGVILGFSEILTVKLKDEPKSQHYADNIHAAGERARKLTAKLLAFSRKEPPEASVTEVNKLISSEQHMLEKTLTARIELKLSLGDEVWPVYLDPGQLQDAILNISINAMHAMPEGGTLTISTQKIQLDSFGKYHINLEAGEYVQLTIADTGIGMDQDTCQKIFDPFFTTKGEAGTGLGMSQVYGFVQQSGGAVNILSEPGEGTRVIIYLPRYRDVDSRERAQAINLVGQKINCGNETILVVDDEPALVEFSSEILAAQGYHIFEATSAMEALQVLEDNKVDLLLSDVIMPKMDGYQLAELVSEKYPDIKIQMVSGYTDERNRGVVDDPLHKRLLYKPFSSDELLIRARETLDM